MEQGDQLFLLADPAIARKQVKSVHKKIVEPAEFNPIARVRVNVPISHLDRDFDYLVPAAIDGQCRVGDRVRVRFAGKLSDAIVVDRLAESEFEKLASIERAVGPALTPEILDLVRAVADRYVGMFWDVVRAAVPVKSKAGESRKGTTDSATLVTHDRDPKVWESYTQGTQLLEKIESGECVRAIWASAPASLWWDEIAELVRSLQVSDPDAGIIILVPDAPSIERLVAAVPQAQIISTHLGQGERYRNFLEVRSGRARVVVGTRSAVFAPVENLKAIIMWDDFNDAYCDGHAPYWDAREVAALRSHLFNCSLIVGGFSRSVATHSWCESGWCESITATKSVVESLRSHVRTLTDNAIERDPHQSRIPQLAWQAIKESLPSGPILVSVGRRGYIPAFLCVDCGERAACSCGGAIHQGNGNLPGEQLSCGRCGTTGWRCVCGGTKIKALAIGAERTAEELGRAFAGTPVVWSQQEHVVTDVDSQSRIVVATQGAEPIAEDGFAAVIVLDMFTQSISLSASESLVRRAFSAAVRAKVGAPIVVTGDPGQRETQAIARWDSPWFAGREYLDRSEANLPPATRVAVIEGDRDAVMAVAVKAKESVSARLMGPIEGETTKVYLVVRRSEGNALSNVLGQIMRTRSTEPKNSFVRIHMDPRDF